jgi:hypothetical protein
VALAGPDPRTLSDPVDADDLLKLRHYPPGESLDRQPSI